MKTRILSVVLAAASLPLTALAHPGHDDGHELTWDFGHLVAHPLATCGCLAVLVVASAVLWQLVIRAGTPTAPARSKAA
jgi:urease accessory protein